MSENPFMKRAAARGTTGHGNKSEKRVSKSMASQLMPASGAMRGAKSDAQLKTASYKFQIESKATTNLTMGLEYGWLRKITSEAMACSTYPAITLSFVDGEGKAKPQGDWVAIPLWLFQELTEK